MSLILLQLLHCFVIHFNPMLPYSQWLLYVHKNMCNCKKISVRSKIWRGNWELCKIFWDKTFLHENLLDKTNKSDQ